MSSAFHDQIGDVFDISIGNADAAFITVGAFFTTHWFVERDAGGDFIRSIAHPQQLMLRDLMRLLQCGQRRRANRCAMISVTDEATLKAGTPIFSKRVRVSAAELVCRVDNTR